MLVAKGLIGDAALYLLTKLQYGRRGVDLHQLFTAPAHRGQGVALGLVVACQLRARALQRRYMMVGTHPDNRAAQGFYAAQGFQRMDGHPPSFRIWLEA